MYKIGYSVGNCGCSVFVVNTPHMVTETTGKEEYLTAAGHQAPWITALD